MVGGVLIILGFAIGFTGYLVDAQIPLKILNYVQSTISSKIIFLLASKYFTFNCRLPDGCIFCNNCSSTTIAPLATYFGIDPFHLAIILFLILNWDYYTSSWNEFIFIII